MLPRPGSRFASAQNRRALGAAAHRDHDTANNEDANLTAFCQRCHMLHDRDEHQRRRWRTLFRRKAMGDLFQGPYPGRGESGDTHHHLIVAHVGRHGRALNTSFLYARLEAVRASCELDFGEPLTASRRTDAVARRLRAMGRNDVAAAVEAIRPAPDALPRSGLTSATRARLARVGISAPKVRAQVLTAYERSDTATALKVALEELGLNLVPGDTPGVWFVRQNGHQIGAIDRLVGRSRAEVVARMTAPVDQSSPDRTAVRVAERAGSAPAGSRPSPRSLGILPGRPLPSARLVSFDGVIGTTSRSDSRRRLG